VREGDGERQRGREVGAEREGEEEDVGPGSHC